MKLCREVGKVSGVQNVFGVCSEKHIVMNVDNQACIAMKKHSLNHKLTFCYQIPIFARSLRKGLILLKYVPPENVPADAIRKPLGKTMSNFGGFDVK